MNDSSIDPVRLHAILAAADTAKAITRAAFDVLAENRDRLHAARRRYNQLEMQREQAPSREWRDTFTDRLKVVDEEITTLQRVISEIEANAQRASAESLPIGRLAIACREYATRLGASLPGPVPLIARGMM